MFSGFPEDPVQAEALIQDLGVTHLLTISPSCKIPPTIPTSTTLTRYLHLTVPDVKNGDLLVALPAACRFVSEAVSEGGLVLIHCSVESRACIVVCASRAYFLASPTLRLTAPRSDGNEKHVSRTVILYPRRWWVPSCHSQPLIDSIFTQLYLCLMLLATFLVTWSCFPHASTTRRGTTASCKTGSGPSVKILTLFAPSLHPLPPLQTHPVQQAPPTHHLPSPVHPPHLHLQRYLHPVLQRHPHLYPREHPLHLASKGQHHYLITRSSRTNRTKSRVNKVG